MDRSAVYHLLEHNCPYADLGGNYFDERARDSVSRDVLSSASTDLAITLSLQSGHSTERSRLTAHHVSYQSAYFLAKGRSSTRQTLESPALQHPDVRSVISNPHLCGCALPKHAARAVKRGMFSILRAAWHGPSRLQQSDARSSASI